MIQLDKKFCGGIYLHIIAYANFKLYCFSFTCIFNFSSKKQNCHSSFITLYLKKTTLV